MKQMRRLHWVLLFGAVLYFGASVADAGTNVVRLAIGPFFAPAGNASLEKAASELPDLLAATLPQGDRFQLVERDKVNAIWSELHLAEAGLTAADSVSHLGRVLSCDWLVSGSFAKTESGALIWVKLINTQDSVVMDLQSVPYSPTNPSAATGAIATFLAQAGSGTKPREFIALGRFDDWSISTAHEDWSQRLVVLLEKRFMAAGYGVVERDAVAPIFAEYQFQAAGLTASSTNRVKLKPAFWIVDGGCKWIHDTEDKLSVSIRVQKMGGGKQVFDFVKPAGAELEKTVVETVAAALVNTGGSSLDQAQAGEEKVREDYMTQVILGHAVVRAPAVPASHEFALTNTTSATGMMRQMARNPAFVADREALKAEGLKAAQQAVLLNPNDAQAKFFLGFNLLRNPDAAQRQQGADMLAEVAASTNVVFATRAKNMLDDVRSGKVTFEAGPYGQRLVMHGQTASFPPVDTNAARAAGQARITKLYAPQNLATPAESMVTIPPAAFVDSGQFGEVTATKLWNRILLIATGTTLQAYDLDAHSTHEVGLPVKLKAPISAIEAEPGVLWLGTAAGLMRIALADGSIREFGGKDGFPAPAVTALQLAGGRLLIGFNGALGCLDTAAGRFTGMMAGVNLERDWAKVNQAPPASYIRAITTYDGNNFWIASQQALQNFDRGANKWEPGMPLDLANETGVLLDQQMSVNLKYVAVCNNRHCFSARQLPGTNWMTVNLRTNSLGVESSAIALDQANPDWLWITDYNEAISLVDLATLKILATGTLPRFSSTTQWIFPAADQVLFLVSEARGGSSLRSLDRAMLFKPNLAAMTGLAGGFTNVAMKSEHPVKITQGAGFIAELHAGSITACFPGKALGSGTLLLACGTNLYRFDWSGVFGIGSGTDFEKVDLPLNLDRPITAIASDDQYLWLGTDGGGLIRIPQAGGAPSFFNEKDGFPMSSIRSLTLVPGQLMIGFGRGMDGSFGYLDTGTLKFTGAKPSGISLKIAKESLPPPPRHSVWQIKYPYVTNTYWMASESALYRLKFDSQEWSLQLPSPALPDHPLVGGLRTLTAFTNHVATILASGGVGIYNVPEDKWAHVNLSTNRMENEVTTLAIQWEKPNYLWLGGHGKITLLDMNTQEIVTEFRPGFQPGAVEFIVPFVGDIFFLQERAGGHELYHWKNPTYP